MALTNSGKISATPGILALTRIISTAAVAGTLALVLISIAGSQSALAEQSQDTPASKESGPQTTQATESKDGSGSAESGAAPASVVQLTIDYGDGAQKRFTAVPWKEKMTVLEALQFAKAHPHGVKFESRGKGKITFLTQIDDVKNQAGGGRNWIFYVNDKRAEASFAVTTVPKAGAILWRFEEYK